MKNKAKVGRNELCPCGSQRKFKKCCLLKAQEMTESRMPPLAVVQKAIKMMRETGEAHRRHRQRFGEVREPVAMHSFGKRLVAVRNQIYAVEPDQYFGDFLRDFVVEIFGAEWWQAEMAKQESDRHLVVEWKVESDRYMSSQPRVLDGSHKGRPSGIVAAFVTFGYDLFIVADNCELDELFLNRLRNRDLFQGARHELFAQATCLRAGFSIQPENEQDGNSRHAEFTATHNATGQRLSIEAKSKHRSGVLGVRGQPEPHNKLSLRFGTLINDAVRKNPPHPLVIFLDTNLPFTAADRLFARAADNTPSHVLGALLERIKEEHHGRDPYSMIIFSNHPHHYAAKDELDPQKHLVSIISDDADENIRREALLALHKAAGLYGNVPNEFPAKRRK